MDIAIIGAGNVGRSLATAFVRAGHTVAITSHDPDDAGAVAAATGATFSGSNLDAASAASVVVLAVPFSSAADIAAADDDAAREVVLELVESIGLTPVAVGPLVRARQLEGLAFLNISLNIANGGSWQSGWKLVGAPVALAD